MVQRVLRSGEGTAPPPVDQYDCIVVDECHRGYLLDRDLSDTELGFRSQDDYISKYRRILDYFDAVKIGLTATPALHTSVEDDAVLKITGAADKPLELIRRYKNERNLNVAVTVDLLTTGIDVPEICNLVFVRRVNSRNQDIAARIIGYIRQAALGDALVPFEQRVDRALQRVLASKSWTTPQRQWLQKIAAQTKANQIVDRAALDDPDQVFKRDGGGFARLDRIFGGGLQQVLDGFNDSLWSEAA